jgi:hypothetical protein
MEKCVDIPIADNFYDWTILDEKFWRQSVVVARE